MLALPAAGQLDRVRGRHWVVTEVAPTALPYDVKSATVGGGQTLVTLSSVEDDGLGEDLRVLWELEAGRSILDSATLPDLSEGRYDDPATLGALLDALRWVAVTNAETTVPAAPLSRRWSRRPSAVRQEAHQGWPGRRSVPRKGRAASRSPESSDPPPAPTGPAGPRPSRRPRRWTASPVSAPRPPWPTSRRTAAPWERPR